MYSLLSGDELLAEQQAKLSASYVVHSTVDPNVLLNAGKQALDDQEGGDADDPDVVIVNARNAIPADGLLSIPELVTLFSSQPRVRSSYDIGLADYLSRNFSITTFGDRVQIPPGRHGSHEPEYTSYAHYWKTVLGKTFLIPRFTHSSYASRRLCIRFGSTGAMLSSHWPPFPIPSSRS